MPKTIGKGDLDLVLKFTCFFNQKREKVFKVTPLYGTFT